MKLIEIVSWYQKKIGTYDKEPWEKTVEEKILDGFNGVTLKTAKLKTELIDVDLVRGSTFPKAKPKQSLLTVIRLTILRCLLLPVYTQWWVRQTSLKAFILMFAVYITQMMNWAIYGFNINRLYTLDTKYYYNDVYNVNASITWKRTSVTKAAVKKDGLESAVLLSDLLIPTVLALILSFIHSQIVATNIAQSGSISTKRRRSSKPKNQNGRHLEVRSRRRKKLVRQRNQDNSETNLITQSIISQCRSMTTNVDLINKLKDIKNRSGKFNSKHMENNDGCCITTTAPSCSTSQLKLNHEDDVDVDNNYDKSSDCLLRRRNVNWHSPIHNYADTVTQDESVAVVQEKQQQTSMCDCKSNLSSTSSSSNNSGCSGRSSGSSSSSGSSGSGGSGGCDGSSGSVSGSGGSTSNAISPRNFAHIDDAIQEFVEDLIQRTVASDYMNRNQLEWSSGQRKRVTCGRVAETAENGEVVVGEDDGFESLNGKSSSGEDVKHGPSLATLRNQRLFINNTTNNADIHQKYNQKSRDELNKEHMSHYIRLLNFRSVSTDETEEGGDENDVRSNPSSPLNATNYNECTTSATEWLGITTNSEECSYCSELGNSDNYNEGHKNDDYFNMDMDFTQSTLLNPIGVSDRISCTLWDQREIKKAQMSVLEISSCIIENVESMPETNDYVYISILFSLLLSLVPCSCRLIEAIFANDRAEDISYFDIPIILWEKSAFLCSTILKHAFGQKHWERTILILGFLQRFTLTLTFFLILAVAERIFKQRFLYAKLFSHLTSSRRARKSNLPHFRLNKVRNIKTWLSIRSYLKKRGPQRSVDVIVSAAFTLTLFLLGFLSVEWLKDSVQLHSHLNMEALLWSATIGIFVLRYMTLGNKIHHKYRSVSVLITEQINLYLQIEKKPKKKDEFMVSNSVLKLAADLLKELETPFKISGLSANPYVFTTIKVFILSALSGILSEMLGFKLKLHKIKIK